MNLDPELQAFAKEFAKRIIPEVEEIVEVYRMDSEEGFIAYILFLKRHEATLKKIARGLRDHVSAGLISPRLLRDPLSIKRIISRRSSREEDEAHVVGYLKAILQLVYCVVNGLEGWQFPGTPLHEESMRTQDVYNINVIPPLVQIIRQEIDEEGSFEGSKVVKKDSNMMKEKKLVGVERIQTHLNEKKNVNIGKAAITFTAHLMAYYRAQECKLDSPLIIDPLAERLAGDISLFVNKHKRIAGTGDYPIVRSYYLEQNLLTPWCENNSKSQIVLLGAGLDTRAYRFKPLQTNKHAIFEIDFARVNRYKEEILRDEVALCDLVRLSADISNMSDWASNLRENGFSDHVTTFWVLEGLVYYLEQEVVVSLLKKTAEMCPENSQIFVDVCVPALAEVDFGPFMRHFKWGLEIKDVPIFFVKNGWTVECSFADDHDQGRDVGQRGLIFIHGVKKIKKNK